MTPRYVGRLCAESERTGVIHVQKSPDRPASPPPSNDEVEAVFHLHAKQYIGMVRTGLSPNSPQATSTCTPILAAHPSLLHNSIFLLEFVLNAAK